ncbi:MAG: DUF1653 domain-containing protein [Patescibacteria group bacterium]
MKKLEIGAIYEHYKGTKVRVLLEVQHSETLEPLTVYIHLEDGGLWARPTTMFLETITKNGREVERFRKIESEILIKPISGNK